MQFLPPALAPLGAWGQFVTWMAQPNPQKPGKLNKFPTDWQTGHVVDAHNRAYWTSAAAACALSPGQDRGHGAGAGFVFTDEDPFFFLDIDGAYDPVTSTWSPLAIELCGRLAGAAVEVSVSGRGLHIIGRTAKPVDHAKKNTPLGLELYTSKRFVALTGLSAVGDAALDCTAALAGIVAQYFPPSATGDWAGWTHEPVAEYTGPADDEDLLRRAFAASQRNASAAFGAPGGGPADVTFMQLFNADADALAAKWPSDRHPYDRSSADMALANQLAFWTGKNCERMKALMERSALARDKWTLRGDYLGDTIVKACGFTQTVYSTPRAPPPPPIPVPTPETMQAAAKSSGRKVRDPLSEFMPANVQLEYFAGCHYDNTTDKVYSLPKNTLFSRSSFDVNYGGHLFILDPAGAKTTTSAWEALLQSRVNMPPIVDGLCFRPEEGPGALINEGNRVYANSYVPHTPHRLAGDPGKFLRHMELMLPDAHDRKLLLSYMASLAQNPGKKFQWWPVVQGAEGNGKSILIQVLTHVIGQEYTHLPNAHAMARDGNKFNGWIYRKLFIGVEEIMLSHKRDFLDEFKVVVTNSRIPLEKKGQDQFTGDNRVNGILCTNFKDGVPITTDGRRYAIFFTAQQDHEDWQTRFGMDKAYFSDLTDWLNGWGAYKSGGRDYGCAVVADFLLSMEIEAELDPARLSNRAPKTSSTPEAVHMSLGPIEQEILDAAEEGRPGFAGGWVSSRALNELVKATRTHIPLHRRRGMMRSIGYDYHPALPDGRVNAPVNPDMCKPRLYVKKDHPTLGLTDPNEVARAYTKAQETALATAALVQFSKSA